MTHSGAFTAHYAYAYDPAGRVIRWRGEGADWVYQYSPEGELSQATHGLDLYSYSYDAVGNRLGDGRTYDSANRLTEDLRYTYGYDARGNLTHKQDKATGARTVYTWDALDQLLRLERYPTSAATTPDKVLTYTYGPLGRRWSRTEDGLSEHYVYDGYDRIATLDSGHIPLATVTFGPAIDEPLGLHSAQGERYFYADRLGSVMALSDANQVTTYYRYDPYGRTSTQGNDLNPFRYTAREFEAEDLYYYRARYYDPTTGRFLSEDPLGLAGGLNLYAYVGGDPVNATDPFGNIAPAIVAYLRCVALCAAEAALANALAGNPVCPDEIVENCALECLNPLEWLKLGKLSKLSKLKPVDDLSKSGQSKDPADKSGQLTRAVRALQKHGSRTGSAFPEAKGNPSQKNQQGQDVLDDILTTPGSTTKQGNRFGGIDIIAPDGRGARFDANGEFRGFLEP